MFSDGFEPAIPAIEQLQTYALDRTATDRDWRPEELISLMSSSSKQSKSFISLTCHIVEILTVICPILE